MGLLSVRSMLDSLYKILVTVIVSFLSFAPLYSKEEDKKGFTVVIDAGHGGKDIGATENGVMEKNINLKVAKQLEALINKKMKNANVVMTRNDDSYLTLQERADKANKAQGDIFISIHTNSVSKKNKNRKNLSGSSVYTLGLHKNENNLEVAMRENSVIELEKDYEKKYSGFDPQRDESYIIFEMAQKKNLARSISLADNIEKELEAAGRENRGVHQAGFWVLWATSMPSVLVELDFICNPEAARYISSDKGAKEMAEAILKAVKTYELALNKQTSVDPVQTTLAQTYSKSEERNREEVYTEGESDKADVTYTVISNENVATARKRINKEKSENLSAKVNNVSTARRRRSDAAKQLSANNNYEKENLVFPLAGGYETSRENEDKLMAQETTPLPDKTKKNKKTEKKKEAKPKVSKQSKKRKDDAHNAKVNKLVTVYKIQLLASHDLLNQGNSRFCGFSPISTFKENNLYKYYYGESTDKKELEAILAYVRKKIPDAFIVTSQKSVTSK